MKVQKTAKEVELEGNGAVEEQALQVVIFHISGEAFGIDIFRIAEITKVMEITKVPRSLPFVEGIINLRGKIIPIVDLRKRLGFDEKDYGSSRRIIIVRMDLFNLGILVDSVSTVADIPVDTMEDVPPATLEIDTEYISGVGHLDDNLVILLDLDKILTPQEKESLVSRKRKKLKKKT